MIPVAETNHLTIKVEMSLKAIITVLSLAEVEFFHRRGSKKPLTRLPGLEKMLLFQESITTAGCQRGRSKRLYRQKPIAAFFIINRTIQLLLLSNILLISRAICNYDNNTLCNVLVVGVNTQIP